MTSAVKSVHLVTDGQFEIDMGLLVFAKEQYYGKKYLAELLSLLVVTTEGPILVDTGMGELPANAPRYMRRLHTQTLTEGLATHGLSPDDVHLVVNTHLHYDHAGNNPLFRNATFVVQEKELGFARDPPRFQKGGYAADRFAGLDVKAVDGDAEVAPGVKLIATPGHTPGHQSVVVRGPHGPLVFTGDAAPLRENLELRNIVGVLHDPVRALESLDRLRALPGHVRYVVSHEQGQDERGFEIR